jgi:DNA invertase Pin-like site-specific DNA recombinase
VDFVSLRDAGIDTTSAAGRLMLHLVAAFAEYEREMIKERVVAGVRRAQAAGKHCGRPRVEIDLRPSLAMLDQGHGLKTTAKALGVSRATLRRRLVEAGEWPRPTEGVQKSLGEGAA